VDIRLIAATNRDLRAMIKSGTFRDDLYYRLSATAIIIPPLRERGEAIDALAAYFIQHYNRLFGKQVRWIARRALEALRRHDWPGNVREFSHAIQSAVMLTDDDRMDFRMLPESVTQSVPHLPPTRLQVAATESPAEAVLPPVPERGLIAEAENGSPLLLDEVIRRTLVRSLEETEGNRRRAADLLGISRSTLYRMLERYSLAEQETGRNRPRSSIAGSSGASSI
jgi:transcriptional regulator with PAS, ATPase and Fis domain